MQATFRSHYREERVSSEVDELRLLDSPNIKASNPFLSDFSRFNDLPSIRVPLRDESPLRYRL